MENPRELFDSVALYLRENGYEFVVDQVRVEIANGRLTEERIKTLKEVDAKSSSKWVSRDFKASPPAEFVRRQDYSDTDAVVLLLEAAKRAIVDPGAMVSEIQATLKAFDVGQVVLDTEDSGAQQIVVFSNGVKPDEVRARAREIDDVIRSIRSEA